MLTEGLYIVSAGGSGIGLAISQEIARCGGTPVVLDPFNDPSSIDEKIVYYQCDVSDEPSVSDVVSELSHGSAVIRGLVNCAGIAGPTDLIENIEHGDWLRVMQVNLLSATNLMRNIVPVMKKQRFGSIVSISSSCTRNGFPQRAPYVVSKAALEMLSETMAMELGPWGIRSNIVLPGVVEGPRIEHVIARQSATRGISNEQARHEFTERASMKSMVTAQDVAQSVRFLLSNEARHVSGQKISVCGNFEGYSSEMIAHFVEERPSV